MRSLGLIALGIFGACAILIVADSLSGLVYRTSTEAQVDVISPRSGDTQRAIILFPGYLMSGEILARAFAPFVSDTDALVATTYAQRGIDVAQIYNNVMTAVSRLKPREIRVYGASIGGMVSKDFLDIYRSRGLPFGEVVLVLDSAPGSAGEVRRPSWLFKISCLYHGGFISSAAWAAVSKLIPTPPTESGARPRLVRAAHEAGAWAGTPAAASQACFLKRFGPMAKDSLVGVARSVVYLEGVSPDRDPLVRVPAALDTWRHAFPGLVIVQIPSRQGRWHLPLVEQPRDTARALIATY